MLKIKYRKKKHSKNTNKTIIEKSNTKILEENLNLTKRLYKEK